MPAQTNAEAEATPRRSYFDTAAASAPVAVAAVAETVAVTEVVAAPVVAESVPAPIAAPVVEEAPAAAPVAPTVPVVPAVAAAAEPAPQGLPKIASYTLPLEQLNGIAAAAGLQWVNSDAEKVAAVQAAIAAEPKPVHVPRERPPVVVLDEGPLVLVETRKDLAAMVLPFEREAEREAPTAA